MLIKTPQAIEKMRRSGQLAARVLDYVDGFIAAGITTGEINDKCHRFIVEDLGAFPSCLNYQGFPKSLCTSVNHVVCHGIPSDRKLKDGDIVNVDVTVEKDGYHGDTSRMYLIGKPSRQAQRLVQVAKECLYLGIEQARPGHTLGDIGHAVESHAHKHGYQSVHEYCGHGIGLAMHEEPKVLHYGKPGKGLEIQPGMTFTIEPMINAGKRDTKLLADGWTVVTKDRSLSAQWEHTLLITQTGAEILTQSLSQPLTQS